MKKTTSNQDRECYAWHNIKLGDKESICYHNFTQSLVIYIAQGTVLCFRDKTLNEETRSLISHRLCSHLETGIQMNKTVKRFKRSVSNHCML